MGGPSNNVVVPFCSINVFVLGYAVVGPFFVSMHLLPTMMIIS